MLRYHPFPQNLHEALRPTRNSAVVRLYRHLQMP